MEVTPTKAIKTSLWTMSGHLLGILTRLSSILNVSVANTPAVTISGTPTVTATISGTPTMLSLPIAATPYRIADYSSYVR